MKKLKYLLFLAFYLVCGCSYLEIHNAKTNEIFRESDLTSVLGKDGDVDFYYYFDEKVFINLRQNLILLGFYDSVGLEDFVSTLTTNTGLKIEVSIICLYWNLRLVK